MNSNAPAERPEQWIVHPHNPATHAFEVWRQGDLDTRATKVADVIREEDAYLIQAAPKLAAALRTARAYIAPNENSDDLLRAIDAALNSIKPTPLAPAQTPETPVQTAAPTPFRLKQLLEKARTPEVRQMIAEKISKTSRGATVEDLVIDEQFGNVTATVGGWKFTDCGFVEHYIGEPHQLRY